MQKVRSLVQHRVVLLDELTTDTLWTRLHHHRSIPLYTSTTQTVIQRSMKQIMPSFNYKQCIQCISLTSTEGLEELWNFCPHVLSLPGTKVP